MSWTELCSKFDIWSTGNQVSQKGSRDEVTFDAHLMISNAEDCSKIISMRVVTIYLSMLRLRRIFID